MMMFGKYDEFVFHGLGLFKSLLRWVTFLLRTAWAEWWYREDFSLTPRRIVIFTTYSILITLLMIWNHIGFALDNIFFHGWDKTEIIKPLFVVGNARSGTTWLHRLITTNTARFTTLKTWEIVFAASITWRLLFFTLYNIDSKLLRGMGYSFIQKLENILLGETSIRHKSVHPVGLMEAEEDEWLMLHVAYAQLTLFFYPLGCGLRGSLITFDCPNLCGKSDTSNSLSYIVKREIFQYYKKCVQKHMFFHTHYQYRHTTGTQKSLIFVSKNPTFTLRIPSIYEAFPDARIVCMLRDPVQSIPSMISYIAKVWRAFASPVRPYPLTRTLLASCQAHYLFPLQHLRVGDIPNTYSSTSSAAAVDTTTSATGMSAPIIDTPTDGDGTPCIAFHDVSDAYNTADDASISNTSLHSDDSLPSDHGETATCPAKWISSTGETTQGAFVSYHHLLRHLDREVLGLLARLYGQDWYATTAADTTIPTTSSTTTSTTYIGTAVGSTSNKKTSSNGSSNGSSSGQVDKVRSFEESAENEEISAQDRDNLDEFRAFLSIEQIKAGGYKTQHFHSLGDCCDGMKIDELKLSEVYEAHPGAFE